MRAKGENDATELMEKLSKRNISASKDMEDVLWQIRFVKDNDPFKRALSRGISFHHAGLSKKKRDSEEILFRCRFLKVGNLIGAK